MKKMMMALAVVAMVGVANAAASYNYGYTVYVGAYGEKDASPSDEHASWYGFYGMTQATAKILLGSNEAVGFSDVAKWLGANFAENSATLIDSSQSLNDGTKVWLVNWSQYQSLNNFGLDLFTSTDDYLCVVLFDNGTDQAYNVLPANGKNQIFDIDDEKTSGSGWIAVESENVPEPTSGLLMLLGMAGLALKRRRAQTR